MSCNVIKMLRSQRSFNRDVKRRANSWLCRKSYNIPDNILTLFQNRLSKLTRCGKWNEASPLRIIYTNIGVNDVLATKAQISTCPLPPPPPPPPRTHTSILNPIINILQFYRLHKSVIYSNRFSSWSEK